MIPFNEHIIPIIKEEVGLSDIFSYDLIVETIWYIMDTSIPVKLGIEGEISRQVKDLYFHGYSDLEPIRGVITILKDIEVVVLKAPYIKKGILPEGTVFSDEITNIDKYLDYLDTVIMTMGEFIVRKFNPIYSISQLSANQLMDPLFKMKLRSNAFRKMNEAFYNINDILFIEDGSGSMIQKNQFDKLSGVINGLKKYERQGVKITKQVCSGFRCRTIPLEDIVRSRKPNMFRLTHYLDNITVKCDIVIICTDAYSKEFRLSAQSRPTIVFNVGDDVYTPAKNIKIITL